MPSVLSRVLPLQTLLLKADPQQPLGAVTQSPRHVSQPAWGSFSGRALASTLLEAEAPTRTPGRCFWVSLLRG